MRLKVTQFWNKSDSPGVLIQRGEDLTSVAQLGRHCISHAHCLGKTPADRTFANSTWIWSRYLTTGKAIANDVKAALVTSYWPLWLPSGSEWHHLQKTSSSQIILQQPPRDSRGWTCVQTWSQDISRKWTLRSPYIPGDISTSDPPHLSEVTEAAEQAFEVLIPLPQPPQSLGQLCTDPLTGRPYPRFPSCQNGKASDADREMQRSWTTVVQLSHWSRSPPHCTLACLPVHCPPLSNPGVKADLVLLWV